MDAFSVTEFMVFIEYTPIYLITEEQMYWTH